MWFWNVKPTPELITQTMEWGLNRGYAGFGILPYEKTGLDFMGPEYLAAYRQAIETAARLGQKMCLYDEYWFPSGAAGGLLRQRFPEALSQRLEHVEREVIGPVLVEMDIPTGELMAAVAIDNRTGKRIDLGSPVQNGHLSWPAPQGSWTVMAFVCVADGSRDLVDYLNPDAVSKFLAITYQGYYEAFGPHFGKTIDSAFYDEPTMHWVANGRAWTPGFNRKFEAVYHRSPATLYPALWRDIGPDTAAARNLLFGFRARLFSEGFIKTLADWCAAKGIQLTGHQDQEEMLNPVCLSGDLIKCFEYQQIPGVDEIFTYARGSAMFKIASSAAVNYGRQRVMSETYGAIDRMPVEVLYKEAMDQFAKGINLLVPHAVWSDPTRIIFPPELSGRTEPYAAELPRFNEFVGRCQLLLQRGRPVVDIAVLYPIHDLQAATSFDGPDSAYNGMITPAWTDYQNVGECLSRELRQDFTYLHPETLNAKGGVEGPILRLSPPASPQDYHVVILPGAQVISVTNLIKIKAFYDRGGQVIATTCLPNRAAESGQDRAVRQLIRQIFGVESQQASQASGYPRVRASSVSSQFNPTDTPGKAVDGKPDTAWEPGAPGEQWLEVDFGQNRVLAQIVICENQARTTLHRAEYWDGLAWRIGGQGDGIGARKTYAFPPVVASKARVVVKGTADKFPRLTEFMTLDPAGQNLARLPELAPGRRQTFTHANRAGGRAWFIEKPDADTLGASLNTALPRPDIGWASRPLVTGGSLTCLHKDIAGKQCYFFANSSTNEISTEITLRGKMSLQSWNPHTGKIAPQPVQTSADSTRFPLRLAPTTAGFWVSPPLYNPMPK